ncbi:MAG TPA: hypothetical protein VIJ19_06180 [Opitutaceae bacterium]
MKIPSLARLVASLFASVLTAAAQDAGAAKSDLSRTPATHMAPYNVDETVSPKTHTLFMGADVDLSLDRDLYRVHDVVGSSWVVDIGGRDRVISAKEAPQHLKITPSLKLTEASVTITGFVRMQSYSFDNDPSVRLTRGLNQSAVSNIDLQARANDFQARADTMGNHALGGAGFLAGSDDQFSSQALITAANHGASASTSTTGTNVLPDMKIDIFHSAAPYIFNNPTQIANTQVAQVQARTAADQTLNGNEPTGKIVSGGMDAIDVSFDARSPKLLRDPYVITMTKFRTKTSKPGVVQNLIYAKSLDAIDEHVSHIHFTEEGFPEGYELIDFQLHIYNRGVELATNVAQDRVELTRDEAFEYVKMEYLGTHTKDTLPPAPAMGKLPPELPSLLAEGKYAKTYYVKVSRDGYGEVAFSDESCRNEVRDPYLKAIVRNLRFKPALDHGKPVDGIASLSLSKLQI